MADVNYRSFANASGLVVVGEQIDPLIEGLDAASFDDLLKFSNVSDSTVSDFVVGNASGGLQRENAIDLNNECKNVSLSDGRLFSGKQNAITIKGGCEGIYLSKIKIARRGGHSDVCLGDHSDQSFERTRGVVLNTVTCDDGKPLRIRLGNADRPLFFNCTGEILFWGSLLTKLNWWRGYLWAKLCR